MGNEAYFYNRFGEMQVTKYQEKNGKRVTIPADLASKGRLKGTLKCFLCQYPTEKKENGLVYKFYITQVQDDPNRIGQGFSAYSTASGYEWQMSVGRILKAYGENNHDLAFKIDMADPKKINIRAL